VDDWLLTLAGSPLVYPGMFALAVLDGFFPPAPSEVAAVGLAALAAASGTPHLGLVLLAAASGAYVGDLIAYAIGRRIDVHRVAFLRRGRGRRALAWAERSLTNGGTGFILAARFLPVARVAVNMAAGALGYPRRRFLGVAAIGSVAWAGYSAMIGIGAGAWLQGRPQGAVMLGIVVGLVIGGLLDAVFRWRQRQLPDGAPEVAASVRVSD
jgi:membrane protein DedA with SNARE-associated domain